MPTNADGTNNDKIPAPGILDILDLSSPLRETYQAVLKNADVSYEEISKLLADEQPEELRIHLNLLSRLGYLEKYSDGNQIRFKLKGKMRGISSLPEDIWKKLDKQI